MRAQASGRFEDDVPRRQQSLVICQPRVEVLIYELNYDSVTNFRNRILKNSPKVEGGCSLESIDFRTPFSSY